MYLIRFMLKYFILEGEGDCQWYNILNFRVYVFIINTQKCSRFLYAYLTFCKLANFPYWLRSFFFCLKITWYFLCRQSCHLQVRTFISSFPFVCILFPSVA